MIGWSFAGVVLFNNVNNPTYVMRPRSFAVNLMRIPALARDNIVPIDIK
jgi:hypothetical protein